MGHLVHIEIVKISPQISHVEAERKYLMRDLLWTERMEMGVRKQENGKEIAKRVEKGRMKRAKFRS